MRNLKLGWALFLIGVTPFWLNGFVNPYIYQDFATYWIIELTIWILLPIVIFSALSKHTNLYLYNLGMNSKIIGVESIWAIVLGCFFLSPLIYMIYTWLYSYFQAVYPSQPFFSYHQVLPENPLSRTLTAFYFAITAGIVEELYFRGLLFKLVEQLKYGSIVFVGLSPILFAAIHWENGLSNVLATFTFGILSALLFLALKNLWPLIIGHGFTDFIIYA